MKTAFIIHGANGSPKENWFPWLKKELGKCGYKVFAPKFPLGKNQNLKSWLGVFKKYEKYLAPDSVVIGHSMSVPFLLSIMEKHAIDAAFLVAGFASLPENKFDEICETFANKKFDWRAILKNCRKFAVFHSNNDPYVKIKKARELAKKLKTKVIMVKNAGHFNAASGYLTFELLLKRILLNAH
jgi:hypothetical protein